MKVIRTKKKGDQPARWHQGEIILHALTAPVTYLDANHRIIWMNQRGLNYLNLTASEIEGARCYEVWQKRLTPCPSCPLQEVLQTGQTREAEITTADGRIWNLRAHPVLDEEGKTIGVVEVRQDITERKKMELAWRESEERFRAIFERSLLCVYIHDLSGRFLEVNEAMLHLLGYSRDELLSLNWTSLLEEKQLPLAFRVLNELIKTGRQKEPCELQWRCKDGRKIWIEAEACLIPRREDLPLILGVAHDISQRKEMEEKLLASLEEKEILLREIHHRVKNNLQVISSLLDLRAMRTRDERLRELCEEARAKIQTMALIHTHIYQSGEFTRIALKNYLRDLIHYLAQIHFDKKRGITVEITGEEIKLSVNQAMPLALVINEAIANAYKHAFPEGISGKITLDLQRMEHDWVCLRIKDNGVGLPDNLNFEQTTTLGWKLMRHLVTDQLRGRLQISGKNGTEVKIEFPIIKGGEDG